MTDTQAQEAARLADEVEANVLAVMNRQMTVGKMPVEPIIRLAQSARSQAARIAELDEQIAELRKSLQREIQRTHDRNVEIIELHGENKALRAELARMREPLSDERIEQLAKTIAPIGRAGYPTWEHAVCRAYEAERGIRRDCWCHQCRPVSLHDMRMVLCPDCGNKRCPKANDHSNACTGSNEPGQPGSAYPAHGITKTGGD